MKTTIKTLLVLLTVAVIITACSNQKPHTSTIISGLLDVTDTTIAKPDATEIIKFYEFDKDKWNGGSFNFSPITRVSLNPKEYKDIGEANEWLSNDIERDKDIEQFKRNIADIIAWAEKSEVGQANSSVYQPMANELNRLSHSVANRKILLVYSDLMENSAYLSYYKKDLSRLIKEPEALAEQLEKIQALDDLEGIEIFFIYQPKDSKSDAVFGLVSNFYKSLFENKGAKVTITANL